MNRKAAGKVYNIGEGVTPTVAERLATLPVSDMPLDARPANFEQDIVYDTARIREELGYREGVPYEEGLRRTFASH